MHEYAHSLVGASGVSDPFRLKNDIERMCNQFAAEFIAPTPAFTKIVEALDKATRIDVFKLVAQASRLSLLSRHATAIRLLETGHIDQKQLNQWLSARAKLSGKDLKNEDLDDDDNEDLLDRCTLSLSAKLVICPLTWPVLPSTQRLLRVLM